MKIQIKQLGIAVLIAIMVIITSCTDDAIGNGPGFFGEQLSEEIDNGGETGDVEEIDLGGETGDGEEIDLGRETGNGGDTGNGGETGGGEEIDLGGETGGGEETYTPSNNANIRAVTGHGTPQAKYGLYYGGMPGIDNGTPQATAEGFSNAASITLSGNNPTDKPDRNVVVIVEDEKVSKVEFGVNATVSSTGTPNNTAPSTWYTLTKDDEYTTLDTAGRRWVGPITVTSLTSSSGRGFYVRITAEDGTEQVYRYWQYISTTVTNNVTRGELTALKIGGVDVITGGKVQGSYSKGVAQGWWNKTVAPDFTPGEVTITTAQAANCAVSATVNNSASGVNLSFAKISANQYPLLENSDLVFGAASSNTTGSAAFTNIQDGDYIVIRQNASQSDSSYKGLFSHYIIKVNVTD